jgi:hypothetical protein
MWYYKDMENKQTTMETTTTTRYYVGDLCYVMGEAWAEVCSIVDLDNDEWEYELEDGRRFFLFSTAYGDGHYNDLDGNPYAVDSGTIGAIKVDDIRDTESLSTTVGNGLGHIHEFPAEIEGYDCSYDEGAISIYGVYIDTADDDDCEEEEEENDQ